MTTWVIDDAKLSSDRSGPHLAIQIAQLLIDIRHQDNEDVSKWLEDHPGRLVPPEQQAVRMSRFTRAFNYMFPSKRFRGIRTQPNEIVIEFEEYGRISTLNQLSTGEKQIIFRASFFLRSLVNIKHAFILIDEPELSLHPEWQEKILAFYSIILTDHEGKHPQMIVATHSPFIIHGSANAKVVILERNIDSGTIQQMLIPSFPSAQGQSSIYAFNIDSFLSSAKQPLLILVEGDSDVRILNAAWDKLRPNIPRRFELRAALGMKNINITLNDPQIFRKLEERFIVGVFDFDCAFDQWKGVWTKKAGGRLEVSTKLEDGLTARHATHHGWTMLLPVPDFRADFASTNLAGRSILTIEFLFRDDDIPPAMIEEIDLPCGQKIQKIRVSEKANFARLAETLPPSSFAAFEPLLQRWHEILIGSI